MDKKLNPKTPSLIGTELICYKLNYDGHNNTVKFNNFHGVIKEQYQSKLILAVFNDDPDEERTFWENEIGEFQAWLPKNGTNFSGASVILRTSNPYSTEEILGALKSALINAWHEYHKKAEEKAHKATIAIDRFEA